MSTPHEITIDGTVFIRKDDAAPPTNTEGLPYVICRCTKAGVHAGFLEERNREGYVVLRDARRIWYWKGAASLSGLAKYGASDPAACKFAAGIDTQELLGSDVCEIIHTHRTGAKMIQECKEWKV